MKNVIINNLLIMCYVFIIMRFFLLRRFHFMDKNSKHSTQNKKWKSGIILVAICAVFVPGAVG